MRMRVRILFALDAIGKNSREFILETVLICVSLFTLTMALFIDVQKDYSRRTLDQVLTNGVENTGLLYVDQYDTKEAMAFYKEAAKSGYVHAFGPMGIGATDILPQLAAVQQGHQIGVYDGTSMTEMYYLKASVLPLCKTELECGSLLTDTEEYGKNWNGLYLGSAYQDIPVGTKYTCERSDGTVITYEVLGILKKGSRWVSEAVLTNSMGETKYFNTLDYEVLKIGNGEIQDSSWIFDLAQGVSFDSARKELQQMAQCCGLDIQIGSLKANLEQSDQDATGFQILFQKMFYLLGVTAIIFLLSFRIMTIWKNSAQYGILYSLGAATKDITWILVIETIIQWFICCILVIVLSERFIFYYFTISADTVAILHELLMRYVYGKMAAASAFLLLFGTLLPIFWLQRQSPIKLLRHKLTTV